MSREFAPSYQPIEKQALTVKLHKTLKMLSNTPSELGLRSLCE
jgi:hypothetical protein